MKGFKLTLIMLAAFAVVLGLSGMASAFHGGGVAHCDGCHSMHNSADNPDTGTPNNTLLKGSDASSTCLNCHDGTPGSYHISDRTGIANAKAGGDFGWIQNGYSIVVRGNAVPYGGDQAGHNIVAADFGYAVDGNNATAPGGTYASSLLGCTSCHDAHGQVNGGTKNGTAPISVSGSYGAADPVDGSIHGNYRILGDAAYEAGDPDSDGFEFDAAAPVARANGSSATSVQYGSGMSEWCANCHDYVGQPAKHVAGAAALLNGYGTNYNTYVATGDFTGSSATAYDDLVPFERGVTDGSLLDTASTVGTDGSSNVMCLTCHRAHASGNNNAGRWDFEVELIEESHALQGVASGALPATAAVFYKNGTIIDPVAEYGPWQRSLCNKCHVQD